MYLKSLELHGFKSFPDKTTLEFGKGLTAIVGPNGSGKSNIGDAVRWVLGEQSSKMLRGGKMEDVIFGGTALRKSVSFATVTLNISNEDRSLGIDSDTVSVMRRLWRNGESEYLINGNQVRLKDVVELFMDTGLGRDGYYIIGQGRVADIVGSKSNERREIFEEAAGISKFRYKKEESERRLASAEDNILRLKDILSELEGRVEPLRIQSEKAKKYLVLAGERRDIEIAVWMYRLDEIKKSSNELENSLLVSNGEYELLTNEIEEYEAQAEELTLKRRQCASAAEDYRRRITALTEENATAAADIAVYKNNIRHYTEQVSEVNEQKNRLFEAESETAGRISLKKEEISRIEKDKLEVSEEVSGLEAELIRLNDESDRFSQELNGITSKLNLLYVRRSELRFSEESAQIAIRDAEDAAVKAKPLIEETRRRLAQTSEEIRRVRDGIADIQRTVEEHGNKLSGYNMLYSKKSAQLKEATEEYNNAGLNIRSLNSRRQMLEELENSMEGFSGSVKSVIAAGRSGRLRGVRGTVAGIITVDQKYSLAIETALGGGLQNIVVSDEDCAKAGIRFLKETNGGRATFLPLTSVKGNTLYEKGLDMAEGYVALASELVEADEEYTGIINSLLGRIVVAENIDLATSIAKRYGYKFRIITLDGQVINAGGSFTGGSASRTAGVLSRKNEIAQIISKVTRLESKNAILKERLSSISAETEKLGFDIEAEKDIISNAEADKIRFEGEAKRLELVDEQLADRLTELSKAENESAEKIAKAREDSQGCLAELESIGAQISSLESKMSEFNLKSGEHKSIREEKSNQISDMRLRLVELEKDLQASKLSLETLLGGIESAKETAAGYDKKISELESEIEAQKLNISEREREVANSKAVIESLNLRIKEELASSLEHEKKENELRQSEKQKTERKEQISAELSRLNERLENLHKDSDAIVSQLWESYNLTVAQACEGAIKLDDISDATKRLNELKSKIRSLGSVNTEAIDEYKEVSERYEFMSGQLGDVTKSKAELEKLIADLTKSMREIFTESFNKINDNFKSIFVELFGGGRAELKLTDPENVLESGIEINVAPPGKVIKNLSLLSGGEQSFVAIAIYFAILKLRPSPFCILDEIEAALDDVNVTRYAQYLRNFTDTTQFILITHRRGTMEEADVLYGVTMQEKGVSKLLKMDVSQVSFTENN